MIATGVRRSMWRASRRTEPTCSRANQDPYHRTTAPNSRPTMNETPIASAPQNATRTAPRHRTAPPTRAAPNDATITRCPRSAVPAASHHKAARVESGWHDTTTGVAADAVHPA